jgi:hypothetical protein
MPGRGAGKKSLRPGEPAGVPDQQTFTDLAEDRDCARGVFIVIRGGMSGMPIPRGAAREFMGLFSDRPKSLRRRA